jgi:hypothetical protein
MVDSLLGGIKFLANISLGIKISDGHEFQG